jgi:hypothetical protein
MGSEGNRGQKANRMDVDGTAPSGVVLTGTARKLADQFLDTGATQGVQGDVTAQAADAQGLAKATEGGGGKKAKVGSLQDLSCVPA